MSRCRCANHMPASRSAAVDAVVQAPVARRGVVRTDLLAAFEPGQGPEWSCTEVGSRCWLTCTLFYAVEDRTMAAGHARCR